VNEAAKRKLTGKEGDDGFAQTSMVRNFSEIQGFGATTTRRVATSTRRVATATWRLQNAGCGRNARQVDVATAKVVVAKRTM
jgi:hypothetical protein